MNSVYSEIRLKYTSVHKNTNYNWILTKIEKSAYKIWTILLFLCLLQHLKKRTWHGKHYLAIKFMQELEWNIEGTHHHGARWSEQSFCLQYLQNKRVTFSKESTTAKVPSNGDTLQWATLSAWKVNQSPCSNLLRDQVTHAPNSSNPWSDYTR